MRRDCTSQRKRRVKGNLTRLEVGRGLGGIRRLIDQVVPSMDLLTLITLSPKM